MSVEFLKFQPNRVLPARILDFVLRDPIHGICSPEFEAAVNKQDTQNIIEGIYSVILNAESRFNLKLTEADRVRVHMLAQDEIVKNLLEKAEKIMVAGQQEAKARMIKQTSEAISKTNEVINYIMSQMDKKAGTNE